MHLRELTNNLFKESKMADIFGTQSNKATQAVIDAASKIMMGVKDDETAKAQTEDQHPAIDPKYKEQENVQEKMSSKEKMKKGLYNEKNMDPVGQEDGDVDNDGDMDDSDMYLKNRRKKIKKAMKKEGLELPDYVIEAIEEVLAEDPDFDIEQLDEAEDLDADSSSKALMHDCAKHVVHKEHGEGQCVPGMHTLEEGEDGQGFVTHYDVMFDDGIVENVPVEELEIVSEMHHGHPKKKKK